MLYKCFVFAGDRPIYIVGVEYTFSHPDETPCTTIICHKLLPALVYFILRWNKANNYDFKEFAEIQNLFLCSNISACTYFRKLSASSNISACTLMRGDTVLLFREKKCYHSYFQTVMQQFISELGHYVLSSVFYEKMYFFVFDWFLLL